MNDLTEEDILNEVNWIHNSKNIQNLDNNTIHYEAWASYILSLKKKISELETKIQNDYIEIPADSHCCNKGCLRCGSLNEEEAEKCWNENHCGTCNMRKRCYQEYIINKNTSVY